MINSIQQFQAEGVKNLEKVFVNYAADLTKVAEMVAASGVYYVESQGHTLIYHTKDGNLSATGTMKDVEESLREHGFSRCNKGYLVNLEYVEAVRNGAAVVAGEELVISRGRKNEFMEDLTSHIGGGK